MTLPSHIFVVGSSRSGTTLMIRTLSSAKEVAICGETRFLVKGPLRPGFRHKFAQVGDMSTDAGARRVVDFIYHGAYERSFWWWFRRNVDQELFLRRLLESERNDRALFDLIMSFYADAEGAQVRGEKTPAHIYFVPTLLEWFPESKIVHMLRDPRAVFVSTRIKMGSGLWDARHWRLVRSTKMTLNLYLSLAVASSWLWTARLHRQYQKAFPENYCLVKFEDLVHDPRGCLTQLCDFLEIEFSEVLLRQRVVNSSFVPNDVRVEGFDGPATDRWRYHLHPLLNRWFVGCCKRYLREFGYQL